MKFSNIKQIVSLTLLWTATLYGVDYVMRPHPLAALMSSSAQLAATSAGNPRVTLSLNHLCCCLDDLETGVAKLRWAGAVRIADNRVDIDVSRLEAVDFVALEDEVRGAGFAIDRIEVTGLPHYRIEADLPRFCCRLCSPATDEQAQIIAALRGGDRFRWLDSVVVNKQKKQLIAYARYGQTADITGFKNALEHLGLVPTAMCISAQPERAR